MECFQCAEHAIFDRHFCTMKFYSRNVGKRKEVKSHHNSLRLIHDEKYKQNPKDICLFVEIHYGDENPPQGEFLLPPLLLLLEEVLKNVAT